jgi:hypothetical protein
MRAAEAANPVAILAQLNVQRGIACCTLRTALKRKPRCTMLKNGRKCGLILPVQPLPWG